MKVTKNLLREMILREMNVSQRFADPEIAKSVANVMMLTYGKDILNGMSLTEVELEAERLVGQMGAPDDSWDDTLNLALDLLEKEGIDPQGKGGIEGGEWSGRELN